MPILGTTRWAEFTGQFCPLRLEQRHPGRDARKAEVKALGEGVLQPSTFKTLTLQDDRAKECGQRKDLRSSPGDSQSSEAVALLLPQQCEAPVTKGPSVLA